MLVPSNEFLLPSAIGSVIMFHHNLIVYMVMYIEILCAISDTIEVKMLKNS